MTLFEQIKSIPKVDMHINFTSSISTDLAFDLSDDINMAEILSKMQEKNSLEYVEALKLPIKILKTNKNIILAVNDLIDKLINNNVIYGELFLDLPLYNKKEALLMYPYTPQTYRGHDKDDQTILPYFLQEKHDKLGFSI